MYSADILQGASRGVKENIGRPGTKRGLLGQAGQVSRKVIYLRQGVLGAIERHRV